MNPFIKKLKDQIPYQQNSRALVTDSHLRVKGLDDLSIYAIGDCASIEVPQILKSSVQLFEKADTNGDKKLSFQEFDDLVEDVEKNHPLVGAHFRYVKEVFNRYDVDKDGSLSMQEFQSLLNDVSKKSRTLPATAQVASQQGRYLGNTLVEVQESGLSKEGEGQLPPFRYKHFGSLVYLGEDQAAIDLGDNWSVEGYGAYWLWRSI